MLNPDRYEKRLINLANGMRNPGPIHKMDGSTEEMTDIQQAIFNSVADRIDEVLNVGDPADLHNMVNDLRITKLKQTTRTQDRMFKAYARQIERVIEDHLKD